MGQNARLLYVGNLWLGSDDRGLQDALVRTGMWSIDSIDAESYEFPAGSIALKLAARALGKPLSRAFNDEIVKRITRVPPAVLLVYKGTKVSPDVIKAARDKGCITACYFPDPHPKIYGAELAVALGIYDIVFSAKSFHPNIWSINYGYNNKCVHVPHGYDPSVHLRNYPISEPKYDVVMIANQRPEYTRLLQGLLHHPGIESLNVVVGGNRWSNGRGLETVPKHWWFPGTLRGQSYTDVLRQAKIVIAPVARNVFFEGKRVKGDDVTARTFQCAAARTFFLHQRSEEARETYEEDKEVPMWSDPEELSDKIKHYLQRDDARTRMSLLAHERAVPAYAADSRAREITSYLHREMN